MQADAADVTRLVEVLSEVKAKIRFCRCLLYTSHQAPAGQHVPIPPPAPVHAQLSPTSREAIPHVEVVEVVTPPPDLDIVGIRRVWPEVLGRIFTRRRVTWTFVSQHASVLDYDGQRLVLGIATVGLTNTFRAGNHAEVVRQALIDEIGLDVMVEGVAAPHDQPAAAAPAPTSAPAPAHSSGSAQPTGSPLEETMPTAPSGPAPEVAPPPSEQPAWSAASEPAEPGAPSSPTPPVSERAAPLSLIHI